MELGKNYVVGDVHGQRPKLENILQDSHLIDAELKWCGHDSQLWFVGDFVDRGADGIGVIELIMRLQKEAAEVGGQVGAVLGNHDVMISAAYILTDEITSYNDLTFYQDWLRFGTVSDYKRLTAEHIEWLINLPCMALVGDYLIVHSDSPFYAYYGKTIAEVNASMKAVLQSEDVEQWDTLLIEFSARRWYYDEFPQSTRVEAMLTHFGGKRLVHGHTPIDTMIKIFPEDITEPHIYANGFCINVDGRMYGGCPGFVYELPPVITEQ